MIIVRKLDSHEILIIITATSVFSIEFIIFSCDRFSVDKPQRYSSAGSVLFIYGSNNWFIVRIHWAKMICKAASRYEVAHVQHSHPKWLWHRRNKLFFTKLLYIEYWCNYERNHFHKIQHSSRCPPPQFTAIVVDSYKRPFGSIVNDIVFCVSHPTADRRCPLPSCA